MGCYKERQCLHVLSCAAVACLICAVSAAMTTSFLSRLLWACVSMALAAVSYITWEIRALKPADSHSLQSLVIQYVFIVAVRVVGGRCLAAVLRHANDIRNSQISTLLTILRENQNTEHGRNHRFCAVKSRDEFRQCHPLKTYADYQSSLTSIADGQQRVLTSDPVLFLAVSSGTTGRNKTIPVTQKMMKIGRSVAMAAFHTINKKCGLNLQRTLVLRYKPKVEQSPCGLSIAPVTYFLSKHFPFCLPPRCVWDIENEMAALYTNAVFALREPEIGDIDGLMATLVYSFWSIIQDRWQNICDDIEQGRVRHHHSISDDLLREINAHLEPIPTRAAELRREFQAGFQGIASRVWPNCRFVRMLTTGGFRHYADLIQDTYMPGIHQISPVHGASEGFLGINVDPSPNVTSYLAFPIYIFFEYIHEDLISEQQPETVYQEQLCVGQCYEVVVTTPMGLYRYRMGDVVKVISHVRQCPVYEFQYRSGQILNLFWEKTNEEAFYSALLTAAKRLGITLLDYTATENCYMKDINYHPQQGDASKYYVLFLEIERQCVAHTLTDQDKLVFDESLCDAAELYGTLRQKDSIARMQVIQVARGTFQVIRQTLVSQMQNQQIKTPRVMHNADVLELLVSRSIK